MGQSTKLNNNLGMAESFMYSGFNIIDWFNGFQVSDGMLGLVGAYIATKDGRGFGFAFAVSTVELALHKVNMSKDMFVPPAKRIITEYLDSGNLTNREEYTFEYDVSQEKFAEVYNPTWWIKATR